MGQAGVKRSFPGNGAGAMGLCGLVATLFTGALIPHCSNQSYDRGLQEGKDKALTDERSLRSELTQTVGVVNDLQESLAALRERIEAANADLDGCKNTLDACLTGSPASAVASAQSELQRVRAERDGLIAKVASLEANLARLQNADAPTPGGGATPGPSSRVGDTPDGHAPTPADPLVEEIDGVRIEIVGATRERDTIAFELLVTALEGDATFTFYAFHKETIAVDSRGTNIRARLATLAGQRSQNNWLRTSLVRGVRTPLGVQFEMSHDAGDTVPKLILSTDRGEFEFWSVRLTRP